MNAAVKLALRLSAVGLITLATFEGFSSVPYKDVAGIWTNGFGNTHDATKTVTVPEALDQLEKNARDAENSVKRCITRPLTQNQYDSFVSFTYNVGGRAFCQSTLVRKFNAGDTIGACNELPRWNRAGGKVVKGLVLRREKERQLCLNP